MPTRSSHPGRLPQWRVALGLAAIMMGAFVSACGDSSTSSTELDTSMGPTSTVAPDAEEIIDRIVAATDRAESFRFRLEPQGAPIAIDTAGMIIIESAEGAVTRPESSQALVTVLVADNRVEMGLISIGQDLWMQDPLTRRWRDGAGLIPFNPGTLFSPTGGLTSRLADQLHDPVLDTTTETAPVLQGELPADTMAGLTNGILDAPATLDLVYDPQSYLIEHATLRLDTAEGESVWLVEVFDVGAHIDIAAPALD